MRRTASRPRGVHPALSGLAANRRHAPPARAAFTQRKSPFPRRSRHASRPRGVHEKRSCAYSRIIFSLSGVASVSGGGFSRHAPHRLPPARHSLGALMRIQPHNTFPLRRGQRVWRGIFAPRSQIFCRRCRIYAYSTHIVTRRSADSCAASSTEVRRLFIYCSVFRKSSV